MTSTRFTIGRLAVVACLAFAVAACGLPRSGPYYEDIATSDGQAPADANSRELVADPSTAKSEETIVGDCPTLEHRDEPVPDKLMD